MNGMDESVRLVPVTPWWHTAFTALIAVLCVLSAAAIGLYIRACVKNKR